MVICFSLPFIIFLIDTQYILAALMHALVYSPTMYKPEWTYLSIIYALIRVASEHTWWPITKVLLLIGSTVQGIDSRFTLQCNVMFYAYADLCSLLAATSQFSILIGQNMQLTGCHNGNEMRNATCTDTQISIEWPYCSFPILCW